MKVFRVKFDGNRYGTLLCDDENIHQQEFWKFDCTPKSHIWQPPSVYNLYPLRKLGKFTAVDLTKIAATEEVIDSVLGFFEMAGEVLPLSFEGQQLYVLNVTECINVLNADASTWLLTPDGHRVLLQKRVFYEKRFTESSIFKFPQERTGHWYVVERDKDPESEFKACVETIPDTGLIFEEVWSSETEDA